MSAPSTPTTSSTARLPLIVLAWLWVGLPFLYGVYSLLIKLPALF